MGLLARARQTYAEEGVGVVTRRTIRYLGRRVSALPFAVERVAYDLRHDPTYVFEEDWDTLILLDGCRHDVWREVAAEHEFLGDVSLDAAVTSPASSSREWMRASFDDRYADRMAETAYVTANPFTRSHVDDSLFAELDEVWRYGWDDDVGVVPPGVVTDRAIDVARSSDVERLMVHYMQPHFPALRHPELGSRIDPTTNEWIDSVWERLAEGTVDRETVVEAYRQNLRDVLGEVETLLANHEAGTAIVSSDHGNGFGERGIYGHPGDRAHSVLRRVPFCRTSASDTGRYEPTVSPDDGDGDVAVEERLAALGYREGW